MGDFNAHNTLWGSRRTDRRGRRIENWLERDNISLLNTGSPTHMDATSHTFSAIDLTITSSNILSDLTWNVSDDHFPIIIEFNKEQRARNAPKRWIIEKANWSRFAETLTPPDVTDVSSVTQAILNSAEDSIPKTSGNITKRTVPWWNTEVHHLIRQKKSALNRFKRHPNIENLIAFKKARAEAKRKILESKRNSWREYTASITTDESPSRMWKKVKSISGKYNANPLICLKIDGNNTDNPDNIAESLADFYEGMSSSTNYSRSFLEIKANREHELDFATGEMLEYNLPFTLAELEEALSQLKKSAPGQDEIRNEMLKNMPPIMIEKLLELFNNLWNQCTYPQEWKEAIVVPILKQNKDPLNPSSYRPVSLTSCLGKVLEKMVNARLDWYLENKNIISPFQSGFRGGRSTMDNLIILEDEIQDAFMRREHAVAVFFDIKGAYDMTWPYNILKELFDSGFRGTLPKFIGSFLRKGNLE